MPPASGPGPAGTTELFPKKHGLLLAMFGISLAYIGILQFHGLFAHYAADEFYLLHSMKTMDAMELIKHRYMTWNGRFSTFFMFYYLLKIDAIIPISKIGVVINLALLGSIAYITQSAFIGGSLDKRQKLAMSAICMVEVGLIYMILPRKGELLNWLCAYPGYLAPQYLFMVIVAIGLTCIEKPRITGRLAIIALVSFFASGANEVYACLVLCALSSMLAVKIAVHKINPASFPKTHAVLDTLYGIYRKGIRIPVSVYLTTMVFHLIGLGVVVASPGHALRIGATKGEESTLFSEFLRVAAFSLQELAKPKIFMIPVLAFLAAYLLHLYFGRNRDKQQTPPGSTIITLAFLLSLYVAVLVGVNILAVAGTGRPFTYRVYAPPYFLLFFFSIPAFFYLIQSHTHLIIYKYKKIFSFPAAAKIAFVLFVGFHLLHLAFQIIFIPETINYHRRVSEVETILASPPEGQGPIYIPNVPQATMLVEFKVQTGPNHWFKREMSMFYEIDRPIVARPDPDRHAETLQEFILRAIKNRLFL